MPEGGEAPKPVEVSRTPEGRQRDARQVIHRTVSQEIQRRGGALDNPSSDQDRVLNVYRDLAEGNPKADLPENGRLPMGEFKYGGRIFARGEVQIAGFRGSTEEGDLNCTFVDRDGKVITDGNSESPWQIPVERTVVLDAQLLSEKNTVKDLFSGDSEKLFDSFTASLPQHETPDPLDAAADTLIDRAAESADMLRKSDVDAIFASLSDAERKLYGNQPSELNGQILVSAEDLREVFRGVVVADFLEERGKILQQKIDEINARIDSPGPEDDIKALQKEFDTMDAQLSSVRRASGTLVEAAALKAEQEPWTQPPSSEFGEKDEKASEVFKLYAARLKEDLDGGKFKGKEKEEREAVDLLVQLQLAQEAKGKDYGPMFRYAVLSRIQGESSGAQAILTEDDTYLSEAKAAKQRFDILLKDNGITDPNVRADVLKKLQSADGITQLAEDSRFAAIAPKFVEGTFGRSDADIYDLLDTAAIAHQGVIDSTLAGQLREFITKDPLKKAGIIAAILLAIAAIPVVAAVGVVGTAGKMGGGR